MRYRTLLKLIPADKEFDTNNLVGAAETNGFPIDEKAWMDIGQWEEYHKTVKQLGLF